MLKAPQCEAKRAPILFASSMPLTSLPAESKQQKDTNTMQQAEHTEYVNQLKHYIANSVLDGKDIGLDETTPLLEWGIINSMELLRLLRFIHQSFGVEIPFEKVTADDFVTIDAIASLVQTIAHKSSLDEAYTS
jgi:acyl carrier protein